MEKRIKVKKKLQVLRGIEQGMKEIILFRKGKIKLKTLDQILRKL
jgi:hypothetical protein